jgi:hypothetical protein
MCAAFKPLSERYEVVESGCWLWTSTRKTSGYPVFFVNGRYHAAHRYFYEFFHSARIPPGLVLDHLCRRIRCVNPEHLEAVTQKENCTRYTSLKTECRHGHPYSDDNLYVAPDGSRECRICRRCTQACRCTCDKEKTGLSY